MQFLSTFLSPGKALLFRGIQTLVGLSFCLILATASFANPNPPEVGPPLENPACSGDLVALQLVYSGPSGVNIVAYRQANGTERIATFSGVQTGDVLTVDARSSAFSKLNTTTWLEIQDPNNPCRGNGGQNGLSNSMPGTGCLTAVPSACGSYANGSVFGQLRVVSFQDQAGNAVNIPMVINGTSSQSAHIPISGSPRRNNGTGQAKSGADLDGDGLSYNVTTQELDVNPGDGIEINSDLVEFKATDVVGNGLVATNNNLAVNPGDGVSIQGNQVRVNTADLVNPSSGLSTTGNDLQVEVDGVTIEIDPNNDLRLAAGAAGAGLTGGSNQPLNIGDGPGIGIGANEIQVNVDNSTIQIDGFTDALKVAPGGITNNELATDAVGTGNIIDGTVFPRDIASGGTSKILTTDGAGNVAWADQSSFTPTQTDGDGLVIDAINNETDVNTGDGLTIIADQVAVVAADLEGDGLSVTNNNLNVNTGDGLTLNSDNLEVVAADLDGNGLTTVNNNLNVNGGHGILVGGDQVRVDVRDLDGAGLGANLSTFEMDVKTDNSTLEINVSDQVAVKQGGITTNEILDGTISGADLNSNGATAGQVLVWNGTAWTPASNDDADADPLNEIQTLSQTGNSVTLSNGGGSISVADNDNDSSNEIQNLGSSASGTTRTLTIDGGGTGTTIDVADNDNDPTNEYNSSATLVGTDLQITDGGGTQTVDLSVLNNSGTDNQNLTGASLNGSSVLQIDIEDGTSTTVNLSALEESADIAQVASDLQTHITADGDLDASNELQTLSQTGNSVTLSNGGGSISVADNDNDSSNEIQNLSIASGQLTISGGNTVTLPPDGDSDSNNEIQTLSQTGNSVSLSNGGGTINVADNDNDSGNEIQTLSQTGTSVSLSNGGGSISVADNDNDSGNEIQTLSKSGSTVTLSNGGGTFTDEVNDADASPTNEIQNLSIASGQLTISGGNTVTLPPDGDSDSNNEIQTLSQTGNSVSLSNGGGTINVADNDNDSGNEIQNLGSSASGTTRTLTIDGGGTGTSIDVADNDNDASNEIQSLSIASGQLTISGGNTVTLPPDGDSDSNNEIQTISKSGSTVTLSNGGGSFTDAVNDADANPTNELQTLSQTGNSVTLSNGGGSISVADNDNDSSNEIQTISKSGSTVTLSNGGGTFTDAVNDADASPTNEIQSLTLSGNTLSISGSNNVSLAGFVNTDNQNLSSTISGTNRTLNITGGTGTTIDVADNDNSTSNELQTLSKSGSTVTLSNGGGSFVDEVNDADASPTNELQSLSISGSTISLTSGGAVTVPSSADNLGNHNATTRIQPVGGNSATTGIQWANDIWGGSGDVAGIKYYTEGAENTKLQIFNQNDADDDIELFQSGGARLNVANGNVGINNTNPQQSLDVNGVARISTLAGSGNRMVIANANGDMSSQTIPVNTDNQTLGISGSSLSIAGGNTITLPAGADNLGNHSATTTLQMNGNALTEASRYEVNGIGFNSGQPNHSYAIYQEAGNWAFPYPDLRIRYHTGIQLSAESNYGGVKVFATNGENLSATFDNSGLALTSLAGSGNRMVVANSTGLLTSQAIPVNTDNQTLGVSGSTLSISGGNSVTIPAVGDNLGNHSATTTLQMNGNTINSVGDILATNNYGRGLVGVYSSVRYQNVFAMGTSWRLAPDGTSPGNMYGLAWTHSNVGGEAIPGLGHQMLVMTNGDTRTALGDGIWTKYNVTGNSFVDQNDGAYYVDPNSTSDAASRIRGGALHGPNASWGTYLMVGGNGRGGYVDNGSVASVASTDGNLHMDASSGHSMYLNYYDGDRLYIGRGNNSIRSLIDGNGMYLYDGWFRPHGQNGIYFETYGGGWHMTDGTWLRAYNSKSIYTPAIVRGDGGVHAADQVRMRNSGSNQYGSINNFSSYGVTLEQGISESGGFHADGDEADIWSPGDGNLLNIWDEDGMNLRAYVDGSGRVYSSIGFYTFSDQSLKENVETLENSLDIIKQLRGVTYDMKDDKLFYGEIEDGKDFVSVKDQYGFIAQEVEEVVPNLVTYNADLELSAVNYNGVIPLLVEAMKEQQTQIETLEKRLDEKTEPAKAEAQPEFDLEMLQEMQRTIAMQQKLIDGMTTEMDRLRGLLENSQADDNERFEEMLNRIYLSEQAIIELGSCCDDKNGGAELGTGDAETMLFQNHPNPFNRVTTITYKLAEAGQTELVIYDDSSMPIETLVNEPQEAGVYNVEWDGSNFTSGVYIYMLKQNDKVLAKKMVLIK